MERKFRITIEGRAYTVLVEDITEDGGRLYPSPAPHMGAAPAPTVPAPVAAPSGGEAAGRADQASAPASADDRLSPLAGVVVAVEVTVGQSVQAGDRVAVIEAMKMKTTVTAHKAGTVAEVRVKPGESVDAGQVLMVIR